MFRLRVTEVKRKAVNFQNRPFPKARQVRLKNTSSAVTTILPTRFNQFFSKHQFALDFRGEVMYNISKESHFK